MCHKPPDPTGRLEVCERNNNRTRQRKIAKQTRPLGPHAAGQPDKGQQYSRNVRFRGNSGH